MFSSVGLFVGRITQNLLKTDFCQTQVEDESGTQNRTVTFWSGNFLFTFSLMSLIDLEGKKNIFIWRVSVSTKDDCLALAEVYTLLSAILFIILYNLHWMALKMLSYSCLKGQVHSVFVETAHIHPFPSRGCYKWIFHCRVFSDENFHFV